MILGMEIAPPHKRGVLYLRSLGVRGGFTPSTRLVSIREGDGWFLVQI